MIARPGWRSLMGQTFEAHVLALRPGLAPFDLLVGALERSFSPDYRHSGRRSRLFVIHALPVGIDGLAGLRSGDRVCLWGEGWGGQRLERLERLDGSVIWRQPTPSDEIYTARTIYECAAARRRHTVIMAWGLTDQATAIAVANSGAPGLDSSYQIERAEVLVRAWSTDAEKVVWAGRPRADQSFAPFHLQAD